MGEDLEETEKAIQGSCPLPFVTTHFMAELLFPGKTSSSYQIVIVNFICQHVWAKGCPDS